MHKQEAIDRLNKLKQTAEALVSKPRGSQEFKKWHRDTEIAVERIFGEGRRHSTDFEEISYTLGVYYTGIPDADFEEAYKSGVRTAITVLNSFIDEIEEYWNEEDEQSGVQLSSVEKVELIIERFHQVAKQLRSRYHERDTLEIEDEYDVQDLFHALLRIYFDDIRPEEYTPSYGGSSSRVDFLLKQERIIVEIKKTRRGLAAKEIGEQLIVDSQRYQAHPECGQLLCFVYDPEGRIANPRGIENDLTKEINGVSVSVFITPKQ